MGILESNRLQSAADTVAARCASVCASLWQTRRTTEALVAGLMHEQAVRAIGFEVAAQRFAMQQGETIHTENSIKYGARDARLLLRAGGWQPVREWCDPRGLFAVVLAEAMPAGVAP